MYTISGRKAAHIKTPLSLNTHMFQFSLSKKQLIAP